MRVRAGTRSVPPARARPSWSRPCILAAILAGVLLADRPLPQTAPSVADLREALRREDAVRRGEVVFHRACAACHGPMGAGDGPAAADLDPRPRDLTSRQFRFRSTPTGELPLAQDLERVIRRGLPGSAMPGFGRLLSSRQISDLVQFVRSLPVSGQDDTQPAEAVSLAPVPPSDPSLLAEGQAVYLLVGCWRCHGFDGGGRGPSAGSLTDDDGRPMRATDFRHAPFKGGRRAEDVVRALRTGLNGTPMPSFDDAMLVAHEDVGELPALEGLISPEARARIDAFLSSSPSRELLQEMTPAERGELRDRRLAALAHYVLSFDRRGGFYSWAFRRRPEREARGE